MWSNNLKCKWKKNSRRDRGSNTSLLVDRRYSTSYESLVICWNLKMLLFMPIKIRFCFLMIPFLTNAFVLFFPCVFAYIFYWFILCHVKKNTWTLCKEKCSTNDRVWKRKEVINNWIIWGGVHNMGSLLKCQK